jgi:hypothetical protein
MERRVGGSVGRGRGRADDAGFDGSRATRARRGMLTWDAQD